MRAVCRWLVPCAALGFLALLVGMLLWPDPDPSPTALLRQILSDPSGEWRLPPDVAVREMVSVGPMTEAPQNGTFLLWDDTTHSLQPRALTLDDLATVTDPPAHGATRWFRWDAPTAQWLATPAPVDAGSTPADSGQSHH